MRIAALYDIHGNLPALEAVLADVAARGVDLVVVGGDVVAGPRPVETLDRLTALDLPVRFVRGNADRLVVERFDRPDAPVADLWEEREQWVVAQLERRHRDLLASFEPTVSVGRTLFCHGTPRSDEEIVTRLTPESHIRAVLAGVDADVVVCGHVHVRYDRVVAGRRLVNAGSVGMPYEGDAAAFWALLDDGVELCRTAYDVEAAAAEIAASSFPGADEHAAGLLRPASAEEASRHFEAVARRA